MSKYAFLVCLILLLGRAVAQNQPFFLPTGADVYNTYSPTVETDSQGGIHMVYPAYIPSDAFYAYCPSDCSSPEQVSVVTFSTADDGTVHNTMLALDSQGKPQVLIATGTTVYYATCTGDCRKESAWTLSKIMNHAGDKELSGEAFALDPQGHPRFVMHSYRAYLGIGAPEPGTFYLSCDTNCHDASSWQESQISPQIWQETTLRISQDGVAHLAMVAEVDTLGQIAGYAECRSNCHSEEAWPVVGLFYAYSDRYVEEIDPAISMVLSREGNPRIVTLAKDDDGARFIVYSSCDANCTAEDGSTWQHNSLLDGDVIGDGLDLALDAQDRPRFAYVADYNIFLVYCNESCFDDSDAGWHLDKVELGSDMPPDMIIPYADCTVAAWFLRQPSLAIGTDGLPKLAWRAEDISGGGEPDYQKQAWEADCRAGADMTLNRFVALSGYDFN
ncbi:MAG: hypothetical protein KC422_11350 [Trueperaceae bacterium]|nr:hypothetical protein [Trueperaceae bacterium]